MKTRRARVLLVDLLRLAGFYSARLIVWRELRRRRLAESEYERIRRAPLADCAGSSRRERSPASFS
jgi:hypothetical protein